ncbi:MAG: hypothetical protein IJ204_00180 [Paludibacteraceae bacterium]|nr:hypothetical protein [Paludibacteraceae bacterium]
MELITTLKSNFWKSDVHYLISRILYKSWLFKNYSRFTAEEVVRRRFKKTFGRELNLQAPQSLNEKIQWLKLNERHDYYPVCADKYAMKQWVADLLGTDVYNVPVLYHTPNWRDISEKTISVFPCIVKPNHSSHDFIILRSREEVNWAQLRRRCRFWLKRDYYMESQEWQYRDIPRQIVVEKLLETQEGKIPNDYKLNYMNGKLEFVYVSFDREGINARCVFDPNWKVLPFYWGNSNQKEYVPCPVDIPQPASFEKMKEIGEKISAFFKYVRVDFYDVDGRLYVGEITLHHGGGYDKFRPEKYDMIYGEKLKLEV